MTALTCIIGIDPGSEGAIASIWPESGLLGVWNIPLRKEVRSRTFTYVDGTKLGALLRHLNPNAAWLEKVHSIPSDGHVGAFTFGDNFGSLRTANEVIGIPVHQVDPQVWKSNLRAPTDKNAARERAYKLFPNCPRLFSRPDKAEAAMIALYGVMHMGIKFNPIIRPYDGGFKP